MPGVRDGDAAYDAGDAAPTMCDASQPYGTTMGPLALEPTGTAHRRAGPGSDLGTGVSAGDTIHVLGRKAYVVRLYVT